MNKYGLDKKTNEKYINYNSVYISLVPIHEKRPHI